MSDRDDYLQTWRATWQDTEPEPPADEALARYVRGRSRLLSYWMVGELVIAVVGIAALVAVVLRRPDPFERLAMGSLGVMCFAAMAFSWWNWRGVTVAVGATTAAYLDLSALQLARLRRAVTAGWIILGAELVIFVPWLWYRQQVAPDPAAVWWPWAFLAAMAGLGVAGLAGLTRWVRREATVVDRLRAECVGIVDAEHDEGR